MWIPRNAPLKKTTRKGRAKLGVKADSPNTRAKIYVWSQVYTGNGYLGSLPSLWKRTEEKKMYEEGRDL